MKRIVPYLLMFILAVASLGLFATPASAASNVFVDGINETRASQGKSPLAVNADLQRVAQAKADAMARANRLSGDGYNASWKGGSQAVAGDPAGRADVLLKNEFLSKQAGSTLNASYGIIGVGEAVSSSGTLYVAVNVAPKPYVPAPAPAPAPAPQAPAPPQSNGGGANNEPTVDNAAEIAAAEKATEQRLRKEAEAAEAKRVEAEKKQKAEEAKVAEEASAKKAEEDAEAKRLESEAQSQKEAEAEAKIKEAQETAERKAAEAKQIENDAQAQQKKQEQERSTIFTIMRCLLALSLTAGGASLAVLIANRKKKVLPEEEVLEPEEDTPPQ